MTAAFAPAFPPILEFEEESSVRSGAQSLLAPQDGKPSHLARAAGVALYALILVAVVAYTTRPRDHVEDEPIPLVMLPAPEAQVEVPPKIDEPPPPPLVVEKVPVPVPPEPVVEPVPQPPPPIAAEPVAPVEPKPVPVPEQKKLVEHKPILLPRHVETPPRPAAPAPQAPPPPNAIASGYANQVHAKIARVAINSYPRAAQLRNETGRVSYHIVIGPSGELISKNIVPSGNATFDASAAEALSRSAPFPATGMAKPVSLSGAITYRMN